MILIEKRKEMHQVYNLILKLEGGSVCDSANCDKDNIWQDSKVSFSDYSLEFN